MQFLAKKKLQSTQENPASATAEMQKFDVLFPVNACQNGLMIILSG